VRPKPTRGEDGLFQAYRRLFPAPQPAMSLLAGRRILVVEDEPLVADLLEEMLTDLGGVMVGPAYTLSAGVALAADAVLDGAVLDVNIRGARIDPVADTLRRRGIPLVFATGYGERAGPSFQAAPLIEKPYTLEALSAALAKALQLPRQAPSSTSLTPPITASRQKA
jgi:CheY-like chemotaxis protein